MIMNPTAIKHVVVDGHSLTLESFVAIARYNATVELAPSALEAMQKSRALAEKIAAEGRVAYGITTGFGEFQKVAVPKEMRNQLSTNLILSHCTAAGEPYADEIVRGMMLLRANALCGGVSGVRPLLVEMLLEMLNKGVTPVVPQKGSLGSSGDLAPLAHMTLPMLGKGEAMYEGVKMTGAEAMAKAGIATLDTLVSKEGLGMTNGTCAMTSVGALALYDSICAAQLGDVIASMSFEGLPGLRNAFAPRIHQVRGQKGQMLVAANMRKLLDGSEILDNCQKDRVQDAYALRCIPQLHGACRDALDYVREKVEIELNAVTDNPLMFLDDEAVISGGNFHGEPMALPFDFLGIAASELADASERRTERMVTPALSNGLTAFLFIREKEHDLNVKGAYLHMLADTLVSVGVVLSGVLILWTGWNIVDPLIGLVIAVVILFSTWGLLKESVRLAMDGVPEGIQVDDIREHLLEDPNVKAIHHLHIWPISTTENALTAHVVLNDLEQLDATRARLHEELAEHGISHATLEFESPAAHCPDEQKLEC